ncbi:MAG: alpha/beta fold hydrolase [Archangiaceae bacterium]|nr:alpha/beta fold hydrolase [Archangiaceae bacterium]
MEGLHHRDEGSGAPVLLLHGLASTQRVFDEVISGGASRHRFVAVDLPRSGSSKAWAASRPDQIAERLMPWLVAKGLSRFSVVGHSFGGLVAMELAARWPERVSRLVIASSPGLGLTPQIRKLVHNPLAESAVGWLSRLPMHRRAVRAYFEWLWAERGTLSDRHLEIYLEALRAEGVWESMLEAGRAISAWRLPVEALRASQVPVRVLWGEKDPLVPLLQGEQLATALGAPFRVLPGVGHCVPEQRPAELLAALE